MDKVQEIDLKDAQARLLAIIADAADGQSSIILRNGQPEAVVVNFADWLRLSGGGWFDRVCREVQPMPRTRPVRYDPPICEPEI